MVFAPSLPYPQYFLHPPKKLFAAIVIGSHQEEKQSMYGFKGLKKKTLFLCELLWQKGLEKLCKIFES